VMRLMHYVYMSRITLRTAREQACDLLREMILSGELPPETHLEEVKLSERIGVSRTPVREALVALEQEGLVQSRPHRGYVTADVSEALVRESFPVLAALEGLAMRLAGPALASSAPRLHALNQALAEANERSQQYELDRAFHSALTGECRNARLQRLLAMERARAQLVDGSHRRGLANPTESIAEHGAIADAVARGQIEDAAERLTAHWQEGMEVVARWLRERG
jgi:DNA-binding GntR family transcriptional regulator